MSAQFTFYETVGNVAETVQGNQEATLYISKQQKDLDEVIAEINNLLSYAEEMNPTFLEMQVETQEAIEHSPTLTDQKLMELAVKSNPQLRERLRRVLTAVSIEAIKVIFAPAGILIEAVKAWIE